MTSEADIKGMVAAAVHYWGRLDWAANNAGTGQPLDDNEDDVSAAVFDSLYALNQRGVWLCQKYEAAQMRLQEPREPLGSSKEFAARAHRGAIVNVASICGSVATGMPAYTATKHAVKGITKTGGLFYGKFGIRCNSVSPGPVLTPEYHDWSQSFLKDERFHEQATGWSNRCPLKRPSTCEEQANVASFLLSGDSSFINCADVMVDGGLTAVADK
jgi:NAD(P)-dependent dehydrogenase (short-subunit alcohol dehydrogenase family)